MKRAPVHNKHLITIHRPGLWIITAIAVVLLIIFMVWFAFETGRREAGFDQSETDQVITDLKSRIKDLATRNDNLQRQNAKLERGHEIDKDAGGKVKRELEKTQSKMMEMQEELTFYRNIVQPNTTTRAVVIKKMQLTSMKDNNYHYKLILIQSGRHDRLVRGYVEITFEGVRDGKTIRLDLPTVYSGDDKATKRQKFGFKYFQNFEGDIRIPDDFVPSSVYVNVLPSTSRVKNVVQDFPWDEVTVEEAR